MSFERTSDMDRRTVLKASGTALAGLATVGTGAAKRGDPRLVNGGTVGYVKGTQARPVPVSEVRAVRREVLANAPSAATGDYVVTNNETTEQEEYASRPEGEEKNVVGYGIAWVDGAPEIKIQYLPRGMPLAAAEGPQRRAHRQLDQFVERRASR